VADTSTSSTSFGPGALATPANLVTVGRVAVAPLLLVMIVNQGATWPAVAFWFVLSVTDGLDGWIARKQGTTRSGAFLDPLADKVVVLGAMAALVARGTFWWMPVSLIGIREVGISLYRSYVGRLGISVPARGWAKVKTVVQDVAVGFALLPITGRSNPGVATAFLWVAVVLTVVTGAQYLWDGRRVIRAL
jgi:CDP-diacylglycerol--glycerol-3-phosphate 3-phosphatidyltransferase